MAGGKQNGNAYRMDWHVADVFYSMYASSRDLKADWEGYGSVE